MQTETSYEVGKDDNNKSKNRFANTYPYDFSRVKLSEVQDVPGSHYINASFVDGYNRKDCYVCAQGPLPTSIADFWRMIWEYRLNNIVMLTGVIEGGKKKCEQYWPEKVGEVMEIEGGLQVAMTSHVPFSDYVIHSMKLTKPSDPDSQPLEVTHFHFTAWPDHGVPQFATSLISFIKRVQKSHDKDRGVPLVVHCSAGVGRTGTFVMLDSMMDRLKVEDSINVYEFLRQMRSKRMYMVQTLAQYVFLHDALDESITCGETDISGSNLRVRVNKMNKIVPGKNTPGFQEQYQLLEQVCYLPNESVYSDAKRPYNTQKNRYPDIVPLNLNRPRLRPDGSDGSDYINASFVDGYKQRNAYIVTQGPLKNTVDDFWRMIIEFKSRCVVMLCNTIEEGQEKCYMYWPTKEGEPTEYGRMKVTLQSELPSGDYIIRKLLVVNQKGSKSEQEGVVITQFHYTMWSEHGHPTNTGPIIEMIDMLIRAQMNTGNKPITVMCNDGVGRSGAFLCIHSQLERLKTEGEVDVFKYLKSARTKRIGLLSEMDHYVFTHEVLADYVESFDPYANFKV